uniref:Retrotransposon gag domain-containing protein n=1 Tax=Oryza rufipogon TaxID=4529 RepID=A0A0E0PY54_ORYRU
MAIRQRGSAARFISSEKRSSGTLMWNAPMALRRGMVELRFGLPLRHNKLGTLAELRRTGTVAEYQGRFMNLLSRAGELTEEQKIELFTMELQGKLLIDVELEAPASQDTAMSFFIFFYFREGFLGCYSGHKCKRLFWLGAPFADDDPGISLYALSGVRRCNSASRSTA